MDALKTYFAAIMKQVVGKENPGRHKRLMKTILSLFLVLLLPAMAVAQEDAYNATFCTSMGGETEVRHEYTYPTGTSYVRVDCETADTVYKGSLDRRSSLDSVQQALFFAHLTGKKPAVVIYNTDGKIGRYEHRIKVACERAGVAFYSIP